MPVIEALEAGGIRGRHVGPGLAHGPHCQRCLRQVIPALGPGLFKDSADDALNALVHAGIRARSQPKEKPPPQMAESGEGSHWPGLSQGGATGPS